MAETRQRVKNRRGEGGRLAEEIVQAARDLLDETGQEQSVTLRAIARRIGITAQSIYGHFPDRESILLVAVQQAFAELTVQLQAAQAAAEDKPAARLRAVSNAYLDFARVRPQRYRVMFGGVWDVNDAVQVAAISEARAFDLGQNALAVIVDALKACVQSSQSASTDPYADAVALWLALHGLAHQRAVISHFPWPSDIAERLIGRIALLTTDSAS